MSDAHDAEPRPDVEARLKELARRQGRSLSRVVNDVVRAGLRAQPPQALAPYDPPAFDTGAALVDVRDVAEALAVLDGP